MSEKTRAATPRRRQEARKKGQVLKSQELVSSLMLLGFVAVLNFWLPNMLGKMRQLFPYVFSLDKELTPGTVSELMINMLWAAGGILGPVFAVAVVVAVAANYLQVRTLFTFEPLKPDLSKISLINGAKRMFGLRGWVELAKSLAKTILIGYFLYAEIRDKLQIFPALQQISVSAGAVLLGRAVLDLAWKIAVAFLIIGVADYLYQWYSYEKNLRMSQEEVKEEFKQTEGNPQIKSQIRRKQREMAMRRMMQDLKKADVVVTNPTHFAVALRYDHKEHNAPFVVAKGQDEVAKRIRELAGEYGIVIMENKPLARALYAQVDIGQTVPADLYKAVAEVLAFVYRLRKRGTKFEARSTKHERHKNYTWA